MRLMITLHLLGVRLVRETENLVTRERELLRTQGRSERGSVTIENVLWAVAVIAIAAIVITAITSYVTTQAGKIR
jgi:heme/copper-type cytochrome/quinol oxidase subunit 2